MKTHLALLLVLVLGLTILVGGCAINETRTVNGNPQITNPDTENQASSTTGLVNVPPEPTGAIIAGTSIQYKEFTQKEFEKAKADGKLIFLFFYTSTESTSITDEKPIRDAFDDKLSTGYTNIVGFRVNYDDDQTDSAEKDLVKTFDVKESRTKVIVQNDKVLLNTAVKWNNAPTVVTQITQFLN